jgi:streptogramin lyase
VVSTVVEAGSGLSGLTVADGALWVAGFFDDTVSRIDPTAAEGDGDVRGLRNASRSRRRVRSGVGRSRRQGAESVDLASGDVKVVAAGGMDGPSSTAVAAGEGAVWATVLE